MRIVTKDEYIGIMSILKNEMLQLAKHEKKNTFFGQVAINNCYIRNLGKECQLYQVFTPGFIRVIGQDYINTLQNSSKSFGTGDAKDVLKALYKEARSNGWYRTIEEYETYLSSENFCLLICKDSESYKRHILRIDLFRKLKPSEIEKDKCDFVGGIFHALKHFSVQEQCASVLPNQRVELFDVEQLIWPIAKAFFEGEHIQGKRKNSYETYTDYLNKKWFWNSISKTIETVISHLLNLLSLNPYEVSPHIRIYRSH